MEFLNQMPEWAIALSSVGLTLIVVAVYSYLNKSVKEESPLSALDDYLFPVFKEIIADIYKQSNGQASVFATKLSELGVDSIVDWIQDAIPDEMAFIKGLATDEHLRPIVVKWIAWLSLMYKRDSARLAKMLGQWAKGTGRGP